MELQKYQVSEMGKGHRSRAKSGLAQRFTGRLGDILGSGNIAADCWSAAKARIQVASRRPSRRIRREAHRKERRRGEWE